MTVQKRWFLSYHSPDHALAERLKAAIEAKDPGLRVFFAPAHLRAGGFWSAQLAQEIAEASAFILLVGERGAGNWQVLEYDEALDKRVKSPDFPVILVLLEGQTATGIPFLRRLHWIVTPNPPSDKDIARLFDAASGGGTRPGELWRYTSPYRGLAAMKEEDSGYFFGRELETVEVLNALSSAPGKLPLLLGNSGVGKSSLAQAGVLAALMRQNWPEAAGNSGAWPDVFRDSRRWCYLTLRPGTEPVRSLVEAFLETWQLDRTSTEWPERRAEWADSLLGCKLTLGDLLDQTKRRYAELRIPEPAAFCIYIDQGEELYARSGEAHRRGLSMLVNQGLGDPRVYAFMSLRTDFFGELQKDEPLYAAHRLISVPPLREAELRNVVSQPAALLNARFETDQLAATIAQRTAEESTRDAGALPLLSYLLDDMWTKMVHRGDGMLRMPEQAVDLGGVLVARANAFLSRHPNSGEKLRRIFTLKLATVREDGEPMRRRALRSEFSGEEWQLVSELAGHPNRLLVTASPEASAIPQLSPTAETRAAPMADETYAEVAHEAIFRRWEKLREWIAAEREFLAWRSGLEAARRAWQATPGDSKTEALLMGAALTQAQDWLVKRPGDLPESGREFISLSRTAAQRRRLRVRALVGSLVGLVILLGMAFVYREPIEQAVLGQYQWRMVMGPKLLTAEEEKAKAARPGPESAFAECKKGCPVMIVVPAGKF
ncbi:MAG: TIR domain-containing protein, partial [Beijerinckiaceae bacterium]|nr:TIR domain-containing protein [Beijerinckiaceae bacterium]